MPQIRLLLLLLRGWCTATTNKQVLILPSINRPREWKSKQKDGDQSKEGAKDDRDNNN